MGFRLAAVAVADEDLDRIASLGDEQRRALYRVVAEARVPLGRDEAAAAVGISRSLAAYHLDRLVEQGLLVAHFERRGRRGGPGAGRPAKLYRRAPRDVAVALPPRNYALLADVLATALETPGEPRAAALDAAHDAGVRAAGGAGSGEPWDRLIGAIGACGYEPAAGDSEVRLRNCPFGALSAAHRDLVCGLNVAFVQGVIDGSGVSGVRAALDPRPDECCVTLERRGRPARRRRRG